MPNEVIPKVILLEVSGKHDFPDHFQNLYHTHLFCRQGSITFTFNDQEMVCKRGEFLFWFAGSSITDLQFSKSFKATVLLVEKDLLNNNIPDQGWSINALLHSRVYPVKTIHAETDKQKILANFKWLNDRFLETEHRFYYEALNLQMQLFILDMWHIFANEYERRKHSLQTGTLYERFIQLAQEHCTTEREVQFYSNQLHITSKYLNQICKRSSGITASEWIQRFARERIIILLQNKNLNISEIADKMEFGSRSFFTRYVKKLLGATPSEYRSRLGWK
ncbi:helix-turn-helix domain-containing protein [Adhaeribacter soli]|uniref:AraC family transcriptional regulator n=1 Tax=Adhaeribacter soli TaxID=2607655 RepID=A0A5N1IPT4_9BACT|nr:helix-turn-helix domain-containing protein [Adhaeribacter soli]KAA9326037.1 AraC family transcriptional regulator [Adhaeribacter soli]